MNKPVNTIEKIRTVCYDIWVDEQGFLRVEAFENAEVSLEQAKKAFDIYTQLGFGPGGKRAMQLMDGSKYHTLTKEAKQYAAEQGKAYFTAVAIITDSAALRLSVNLFNSVYKHEVPFKLFATEEKAIAWLRTFVKLR